jgi:hypothetical protein
MILELSTGGSVQDMLDDPLKAPGGRLPLATVRTDCVSAKNTLPTQARFEANIDTEGG